MKSLIKAFEEKLIWNYSLLVLLLVYLFILPAFPTVWHNLLYNLSLTLIYINLLLVIGRFSKYLIVAIVPLILFDWVFYVLELEYLGNISLTLNIIIFLLVLAVFLMNLAQADHVTSAEILKAINGYLLLGIVSGVAINLLMFSDPLSIQFPEGLVLLEASETLGDFQYFGLVSLTTLGFGEIVPVSPIARSVITFITMAGQLYLAIIIATLVGKFSSK